MLHFCHTAFTDTKQSSQRGHVTSQSLMWSVLDLGSQFPKATLQATGYMSLYTQST